MPQWILERIGLLGRQSQGVLSVKKVEGSRSYQAIVFIASKSNPKIKRLKTKTYSALLRTSLQKTTSFSRNFTVSFKCFFNGNLGDE
jgi:hypothetical protein